jgi:IPT/TIG domain/NHL repeat
MKNLLMACLCSAFTFVSCKKDDNTPTPVPEPAQTVTNISPTMGPKNTVVTITGTNFGTSTTALKVYFNGVQGTVQTATATQITAIVPPGASTGTIKVEKNNIQVTGPVFTYQGSGTVTTLAGSSQGYADGTGTAARFNILSGIVKDAAGNLFVCDRDNHRIRKITPAGVVTTFAGSTMGFTDGTGTAAQFNQPYAITMDASGNFYVGDRINHAIRKITSTGVVTTLAGNGTPGSQNGTGSAARFNEPIGITTDATGNIYVADYINGLIRKVTPAGVVTTHLNSGQVFGLTFDAAGNLYYTTYSFQQVMKYSTTAVTSVIAGQNGSSGTTDGTGTAATFNFPAGIIADSSGNLYVCDAFNHRLRKITSTGVVTTLAGSNIGHTDGTGTAAMFNTPIAICGDFANNAIYIADFDNHRVRKVIAD